MKILLIHPEDNPEKGAWAHISWDRIVDLGLGGVNSYARWSEQFGCPVAAINSLRNGFDDFRRVRNLLGLGCGRLTDEYGLDWWEILSILLHGELETLILLQRLAQSLDSGAEVFVSRPGLHASLLQHLLASSLNVFPLRREAQRRGFRHYLRLSSKLSASQIIDIFWDKYDAGYQFRGRIVQKRMASNRPVVLLPTAYVNVSRTGIAYAKTFPDEHFLLVATRQSGWIKNPPKNVAAAWLSSYASLQDRITEHAEMHSRWRLLRKDLEQVPEFNILGRLGYLDAFPQRLRHGLEVRDAWRNVLQREPVQGVLCADDSNPYTRIPLLLAREQGLPNIACHHGALDGRYIFKRTQGDVILAKGKMEEDYLVRKCGVPGERVEIGAPVLPAAGRKILPLSKGPEFQPYLIFFSELYEVNGGRVETFYRDILPALANLAHATGRELVVKLHPAESVRERTRLLSRVLSTEHNKVVARIVSGPLSEQLLSNAWFGITILSTAAVECAIRGIPCFLCKWLEFWPYGYIEQFIRCGVGIGLNDPGELASIPNRLQHYQFPAQVSENCWQPAAPGRLRELLRTPRETYTAAAR